MSRDDARAAVVRALMQRCGSQCEIRYDGCGGRASNVLYRHPPGPGGGALVLSNLLGVCRACYAWCHAHPDTAGANGQLLEASEDPKTAAAWIHHPESGLGWWFIDNDGGYRPYHPVQDDQGAAGAADPDRACDHPDFEAVVAVNRLTATDDDPTVIAYTADITVMCAACGEPFRWNGVQAGSSPAHPTCTVDEKTLRAPLRPASADPDFGLGIPGFAVTYRPGS